MCSIMSFNTYTKQYSSDCTETIQYNESFNHSVLVALIKLGFELIDSKHNIVSYRNTIDNKKLLNVLLDIVTKREDRFSYVFYVDFSENNGMNEDFFINKTTKFKINCLSDTLVDCSYTIGEEFKTKYNK